MQNTNVTLKNGKKYSNPIWEWNPKEGFFTLVDSTFENDGNLIRIELDEVESAVTPNSRSVYASGPVDEDQLERARRSGWVPKSKS